MIQLWKRGILVGLAATCLAGCAQFDHKTTQVSHTQQIEYDTYKPPIAGAAPATIISERDLTTGKVKVHGIVGGAPFENSAVAALGQAAAGGLTGYFINKAANATAAATAQGSGKTVINVEAVATGGNSTNKCC